MVMYSKYRQMSCLDILGRIESTEDRWIYMTALRGCDVNVPYMKRLFTAFIRGLCTNEIYKYEDIRSFESLITDYPVEHVARELIEEATLLKEKGALYHYLCHTTDALKVIKRWIEEYVSSRLIKIASILIDVKLHNMSDVIELLAEIKGYVVNETTR